MEFPAANTKRRWSLAIVKFRAFTRRIVDVDPKDVASLIESWVAAEDADVIAPSLGRIARRLPGASSEPLASRAELPPSVETLENIENGGENALSRETHLDL